MAFQVLGRLTVALVGLGLILFTVLARGLGLDDNAEWGDGRRLLLYAGIALITVGLSPALRRLWASMRLLSAVAFVISHASALVERGARRLDVDPPANRRSLRVEMPVTYSLSWLLAGFVFLGLTVSGLWLELDRLGLAWQAGLLALFGVLSLARLQCLEARRSCRLRFPADPLTRSHVLIGLLILLPTLAYLVLTFRQEFPFSGDHDHHLLNAGRTLSFWSVQLPPMAAFWVGVYAIFRRRPVRVWALVVLALLYLWSWLGSGPFARYPATGYVLGLPLTALAQLFHWDVPLNANRLTSFLSVPCYLFLLRPLLIGRWPDLALLPFAAFFFFQKAVVYYFTTAYLEPWSVVFVLLAVEALVASRHHERPDCLWLAPLLCGLAAIVKEQAILLLPWIVLGAYWTHLRAAGSPLWKSTGPTLRWDRICEMLVVGIVSAAPFLVYHRVRRLSGEGRVAELLTWERDVPFERALEWVYRLRFELGETGVWLWIALGAWSLACLLLARRNRERGLVAVFVGGALTQIVFFYQDSISSLWTGYPRFHLQAWALWGGVRLLAGWSITRHRRRLAALSLAFLVVGLQAPALTSGLRAALGPDSDRSYMEHYDAPWYFPIRSLFRRAGWDHPLARPPVIRVVSLPGMVPDLADLRFYPDLRPGVTFLHEHSGAGEPDCACRKDGEGILLLFWNPVGLNAEGEPGMYRKRSVGAAQDTRSRRCLREAADTCQQVWKETSPLTGRVTGAAGVGARR